MMIKQFNKGKNVKNIVIFNKICVNKKDLTMKCVCGKLFSCSDMNEMKSYLITYKRDIPI